MHIRTRKVAPIQIKKVMKRPIALFAANIETRTSSKKTFASWECASESAQRRKYEAVFETVPRTNSIVSII